MTVRPSCWFRRRPGASSTGDDAGPLDAAWKSTAQALTATDDEAFNRVLDEIENRRAREPAELVVRVDNLTAHLTEWRHRSEPATDSTPARRRKGA